MHFVVKKLDKNKKLYCFNNSNQISSQTGFIGVCLLELVPMCSDIQSRWIDYNKALNTEKFKEEINAVIKMLRQKNSVLNSFEQLKEWCNLSSDSRIDSVHYGLQVDSEEYTYLFKLCPIEGTGNACVYCYKKDWLNNHIKQAKNGIRFITEEYQELFRVADGESVIITSSDGIRSTKICRYIDEYHFEIGNYIFHICEFAEKMKAAGSKVEPNTQKKKRYSFNVSETQYGRIEVEASSIEEAIALAHQEYHNGNSIFCNTEYNISKEPEIID